MSRNNITNFISKPEALYAQVDKLIKTGRGAATAEKTLALSQLYDFFQLKKKSIYFNPEYERLMKLYVDLCVELRDLKSLKDGLHQYRNQCQNVDQYASSLETVLNYLTTCAEAKASSASKEARALAGARDHRFSDENPETVMLSGMTDEGSRDRADRELVVPWLKFLWETFRIILDLLHKNAKYEKFYHVTCSRAFKFCEDNKRTLEFRKLCETLRSHLLSLQRLASSKPSPTRIQWSWNADSVKLNLKTRYHQLQVADNLELWNEAFRTIEDIHSTMASGKAYLKNDMMDLDVYYSNLAKIFLMSENYLFHAYCLLKHYTLLCEFKPNMSAEEKGLKATHVLMASLIVPFSAQEQESSAASTAHLSLEDQDLVFEKNQQMANLLDFQIIPTRENLLADIVEKGVLKAAFPEFAAIFDKLERSFKPLTMPKELKDSVQAVRSHPSLNTYASAIQRTIVLRVAQQLSQVYKQVDIGKVQSILGWPAKGASSSSESAYLPDLTYSQIERIMVEGVVRKQLNVRVDHTKNSLVFGSAVAVGVAIDERLVQFGQNVSKILVALEKKTEAKSERASIIEFNKNCLSNMEDAYKDFTVRKERIFEFRQELVPATSVNPLQSAEQEAKLAEAEKERLRKEQEEREKARVQLQILTLECERLINQLKEITPAEAKKFKLEKFLEFKLPAFLALSKTERDFVAAQLNFASEERRKTAQRKLQRQHNDLDYFVRAWREEYIRGMKEHRTQLAMKQFEKCKVHKKDFGALWAVRDKVDKVLFSDIALQNEEILKDQEDIRYDRIDRARFRLEDEMELRRIQEEEQRREAEEQAERERIEFEAQRAREAEAEKVRLAAEAEENARREAERRKEEEAQNWRSRPAPSASMAPPPPQGGGSRYTPPSSSSSSGGAGKYNFSRSSESSSASLPPPPSSSGSDSKTGGSGRWRSK